MYPHFPIPNTIAISQDKKRNPFLHASLNIRPPTPKHPCPRLPTFKPFPQFLKVLATHVNEFPSCIHHFYLYSNHLFNNNNNSNNFLSQCHYPLTLVGEENGGGRNEMLLFWPTPSLSLSLFLSSKPSLSHVFYLFVLLFFFLISCVIWMKRGSYQRSLP